MSELVHPSKIISKQVRQITDSVEKSGPALGIGDIHVGSRLGRQILGGANFREKKYFPGQQYTIQ